MRVDSAASYPLTSQRNQAPEHAGNQDFTEMLSPRPAKTQDTAISAAGSSGPDFTSMTRQELFDWMNGQIRSGDMSLDEGSAFMGMTVKISATTGQPVDMAADTVRLDFTEKARQGLEFFQASFDFASAARLQDAFGRMQRGG